MTNTPIGVGPGTNTAGIGQAKQANAFDALQFQTQEKGSTTAELLRGKIGQMRGAMMQEAGQSQSLNFRAQATPSALAQNLMGQMRQLN